MMKLVSANVLHSQRSFAAMHALMIGERGHAFVILHCPAIEPIAGYLFKICVDHSSRIVRLEDCLAVMRHKQCVLCEHAFDIITVFGSAHDNRNQAEPVLAGSLL